MQALPHPLRVSLARAHSLFRPLLPSACYAGYNNNNNNNVNIGCHKHLGAAVGSRSFLEQYAGEKVDELVNKVTKLADLTILQPQASYAAFTSGLRHRWTYFLRTAHIGCYKANFWNSFRSYIYQCLEIWYSIAIAK